MYQDIHKGSRSLQQVQADRGGLHDIRENIIKGFVNFRGFKFAGYHEIISAGGYFCEEVFTDGLLWVNSGITGFCRIVGFYNTSVVHLYESIGELIQVGLGLLIDPFIKAGVSEVAHIYIFKGSKYRTSQSLRKALVKKAYANKGYNKMDKPNPKDYIRRQ